MKTPLSPVLSETIRDKLDTKDRQVMELVSENDKLKQAVEKMTQEILKI